jgi:hypothetical protein
MTWVHWLILGVLGWVAVELLLLAVFGMGGVLVWLGTAIYHAVKLDPPPGENDDQWSSDQGKEVD